MQGPQPVHQTAERAFDPSGQWQASNRRAGEVDSPPSWVSRLLIRLQNCSANTRLLWLTGSAVVTLMTLVGIQLMLVAIVQRQSAALMDGPLAGAQALAQTRVAIGHLRRFEKDLLLSMGDSEAVASFRNSWVLASDKVGQYIEVVTPLLDAVEYAAASHLRDDIATYRQGMESAIAEIVAGTMRDPAAASHALSLYEGSIQTADTALEQLAASVVHRAAQARSDVEALATQAKVVTLVIWLLVCCGLLSFAWLVSRRITQPLGTLMTKVPGIAADDDSVPTSASGIDELDRIARAAKSVRRSVLRLVTDVCEAPEATVCGERTHPASAQGHDDDSQGVVPAIHDILQALDQPLAQLQSLLNRFGEGRLMGHVDGVLPSDLGALQHAVNVIHLRLSETAAQARVAAEQIDTASSGADRTFPRMLRLVSQQPVDGRKSATPPHAVSAFAGADAEPAAATGGIAKRVVPQGPYRGRTVGQTSGAMKAVACKIKAIEDLAHQAKLLALYAGLEAARAGRSGTPLAAIAAELRELADRNQFAAQEIDDLARRSVGLGDRVGNLLRQVVPAIHQASRLLQKTAAARRVPVQGVTRLARRVVRHPSGASWQTACAHDDFLSTAHQLSVYARELQDLMTCFSLAEVDVDSIPAAHADKNANNASADRFVRARRFRWGARGAVGS